VFINDTNLVLDATDSDTKPVHERKRREPVVTLRFSPDYYGGVDPMVQVVIPDVHISEDLVVPAFTSIFGGNPVAVPVEGMAPLTFGHGTGVALIRDLANPTGCKPYRDMYDGEALLVSRGECTFLEKLKSAQAAHASGVIVVSDGDRGLNPSANKDELAAAGEIDNIVLVVIKNSDGRLLEQLVENTERVGGRVRVVVEPDASPVGPQQDQTREPSKTVAVEPRILYLNGHALVNTRLLV
jgi:ER degradation enhancer, mannosidase alpha-like 1